MRYVELSNEQLRKARESALLAVEIYNKPAVQFKSGGYVVLMIIAWTALFHAIFYKRMKKPFYKNKGKFVFLPNGQVKLWELDECAHQYFGSHSNNPIHKNLGLFIPLRNEFEHRSYPELDADIFGECQSLLLNFDELLGAEFGDHLRIRESLSFSLQLFPSSESLSEAIRRNANTERMVAFIKSYRSSINNDVLRSGKFSFKAFLIQVVNHQTKDSLPVQFVNIDKLPESERDIIERAISITREKFVEVPVFNQGFLKPTEVVRQVQARLGNPQKISAYRDYPEDRDNCSNAFSINMHTLCCQYFAVRPDNHSSNPKKTNSAYCLYDELNKAYVYRIEWVDFLVDQLSNKETFETILNLVKGNRYWRLVDEP